ncbi:MAG: peptidylprolyl isomerase [Pseudomonadota bacterium]|nr:peptidylprolyl isomerase [Pseudomonadota bacterium]
MMFKQLSFVILITFFTQGVFITAAGAGDVSSKAFKPEVIFETTMGSFTLELYPEKAPKTVANFLTYINEGFYTNTLFHRVIPGFVVQGGGFEKGMKKKQTHAPVRNESDNSLRNLRGTISMARSRSPHSATSQFFINVQQNITLDQNGNQPGYTVFGKVTEGMKVIDKIIKVPTKTSGAYQDVPKDDVIVLSAKQKGGKVAKAPKPNQERFTAGEHYIVLDKPVATRDSRKIEVVEMFAYGCPHCYEFEPLIKEWGKRQPSDVDFWFFPAIWNKPMKLYARAFYAAHELNVAEEVHLPLFTAIVIDQKSIRNESDLADYFAKHGIDKKTFTETFNSTAVVIQVKQAEARTRSYKPVGVPEIIVNGKYRIDRMRAGGLTEMVAVTDFLINKERAILNK